MLSKNKDRSQMSMFFGLADMLNQKHPMYILAHVNLINAAFYQINNQIMSKWAF